MIIILGYYAGIVVLNVIMLSVMAPFCNNNTKKIKNIKNFFKYINNKFRLLLRNVTLLKINEV
jgi:hypothetical protein